MKKTKQPAVRITSWSYAEGDDRSYGSLSFTADTPCGKVEWQSDINSDSTHDIQVARHNGVDQGSDFESDWMDIDGHPWHSNAGGMLEADAKAVVRKALTSWCKDNIKSGRGTGN